MLRWLLVLFIIAPAVELFVIISVGNAIGGWQTFGLLLLSGFLGAYFTKREGARVWEFARFRLSRGEIPTDSLLDGICIFIGGVLMITPGFLTDLLGLLLVLPFTRPFFKVLLLQWLRKKIGNGGFQFYWRR